MVGLVENVFEIPKVTNYCGRSLASEKVCSEKIDVNAEKIRAEIAVKSTGFREIVAHHCCHTGFPKSC